MSKNRVSRPCGEMSSLRRRHTNTARDVRSPIETYPYTESERLSETEPRWPHELEENGGELLQVAVREGYAVAAFSHGAIYLPGEFAAKLRNLIGRRIAVLRFENRYLLRVLDSEGRGHA